MSICWIGTLKKQGSIAYFKFEKSDGNSNYFLFNII